MILQLSFKFSTVNGFVMKKLLKKETSFSKRRGVMLFPAKKKQAPHRPEVAISRQKKRHPPHSRAVSNSFPLPQSLYDPVGVRRRHNQNLSDG